MQYKESYAPIPEAIVAGGRVRVTALSPNFVKKFLLKNRQLTKEMCRQAVQDTQSPSLP